MSKYNRWAILMLYEEKKLGWELAWMELYEENHIKKGDKGKIKKKVGW
jgi:hypothetical protein